MKSVVLVIAALTAGGCVMIPADSLLGGQTFVFYQVGVVVRVVNNCAPYLDLETVSGVVAEAVPYGASVTIPLVSTPFSGRSRQIPLTAKGYLEDRSYLGSQTKIFYVSTYGGSRQKVWEVNTLYLPRGRGGCR